MATGGKDSFYLLNVGSLALEPDKVHPMGVVVVGDKLVIIDKTSKKVLIYRRNDGMLLLFTDELESMPVGLCCVSDKEFCVAMKDGRLAIISVQESGLVSTGKTFDLRPSFKYCTGVACWNDTILVSGTKDSMICWYFVSLQDGLPYKLHKVCKGGDYCKSFLTVKQDMVYVSCHSNYYKESGVYGFNLLNPSKPTCTYKQEGLQGITVNDIGHLFVCNSWNRSIHHLTGKCQLLAIYKNDIPLDPYAIFWDMEILYLTSWNNLITKFKTPQQGPTSSVKTLAKMDKNEKSPPVLGETKASEQAKGSEKKEAIISPFRHVNNVDLVEQVIHRLSEAGIEGSLLGRLSKDLVCNDWKFFFRELSVAEEEIKQIEFDNRHYSVREQIYQLLHFSNKKGILNNRSLIDALQSIDRGDLVNKYKLETFPAK